MNAKERIVELKCVAPKIEHWIDEIADKADSEFFYKRLRQLAIKAKVRYEQLVESEQK